MHAFIHGLIGPNLFQLAFITIVVKLFPYLLIDDLLLQLILFLLDVIDNLWWFLIPTERTLDNSAILELVVGPLAKTIQMKDVLTLSSTGGHGVAPDYLCLAYSANIVLIIVLIFLLDNDTLLGKIGLDVLHKIRDLIIMDPSISNDIS